MGVRASGVSCYNGLQYRATTSTLSWMQAQKESRMIDRTEDLIALVERGLELGYVAIDTEFVWERTYYARLGVVQVAFNRDECHLIDAPGIGDLTPLGRLLADPGVVKILHDAQQDLMILRHNCGGSATNVFDTRCAAGFVGLTSTLSLDGLLRDLVGVQLSDGQTRSDWLKRPLTPQQVQYALEDVRYLTQARDILLSRAREAGREAWVSEELAQYDDPELYEERDARAQFARVKGAGRLSGRQLAVLRELAAWREEEARRQDRPRGHIMTDDVLVSTRRRPTRISGTSVGGSTLSGMAMTCCTPCRSA